MIVSLENDEVFGQGIKEGMDSEQCSTKRMSQKFRGGDANLVEDCSRA
jgi:hypothetical protein